MKKLLIGLGIVVVVLIIVVWFISGKKSPVSEPSAIATSTADVIATATYYCAGDKTIEAVYKESSATTQIVPGEPPQPTGEVDLTLSDGRSFDLKQTISASGARYSDGDPDIVGDETFVFWNKGHEALVLENNEQKTYLNCIEAKADPGGLPLVYANGADGFSLRYPNNFTVDSDYTYTQLGGDATILGTKFTIDPEMATGTNLSADSYISIETNASTTDACSAQDFLNLKDGQTAESLTHDDTTYSIASSTDAGAGNRYEEWVYAIAGTRPCRAIRYFIHYTVFENYPEGAVARFDHAKLLTTFDAIRDSLIVR